MAQAEKITKNSDGSLNVPDNPIICFIEGDGILVFILSPGAFIALGYLIAIMNKIKKSA